MARHGYGGGGRVIDFGLGGGERPPRDLIGLLITLFATYTLLWLPFSRPLIQALQLSSDAWGRAHLWQLVTYAFIPLAGPIWFLVGLLILFMFGRDVHRVLGRKGFWSLIAQAIVAGSVVAVLVNIALSLVFPGSSLNRNAFAIIQGDDVLLTLFIAAFAILYPSAVVRLFFIIPIRASNFLWLEILVAFVVGFLPTLDLAGFLGLCAVVSMTWVSLHGGPKKGLRELRLRIEKLLIQWRLRRLRSKRKMHIVRPDAGGDARRDPRDGPVQGPWVH